MGVNAGAGRVSNSYWDKEATGQTTSSGSTASAGQTTTALQAPTGYTGIYSGWNINLDADTEDDNPWDFGQANQYPALRFASHDTAAQFGAQPDRAPSFGTATIAAKTYPVGITASDTLPAALAASGNGAFTYTLTGPGTATGLTLPNGLSYTAPGAGDAHGGTIRGLPTTAAASAQYTLTVRDADGNTGAGDRATLTFSLAVAAADTRPASFAFTPRSGVAPGTVVTSDTVTISGINVLANISVSNGALIVDGAAFSGKHHPQRADGGGQGDFQQYPGRQRNGHRDHRRGQGELCGDYPFRRHGRYLERPVPGGQQRRQRGAEPGLCRRHYHLHCRHYLRIRNHSGDDYRRQRRRAAHYAG